MSYKHAINVVIQHKPLQKHFVSAVFIQRMLTSVPYELISSTIWALLFMFTYAHTMVTPQQDTVASALVMFSAASESPLGGNSSSGVVGYK